MQTFYATRAFATPATALGTFLTDVPLTTSTPAVTSPTTSTPLTTASTPPSASPTSTSSASTPPTVSAPSSVSSSNNNAPVVLGATPASNSTVVAEKLVIPLVNPLTLHQDIVFGAAVGPPARSEGLKAVTTPVAGPSTAKKGKKRVNRDSLSPASLFYQDYLKTHDAVPSSGKRDLIHSCRLDPRAAVDVVAIFADLSEEDRLKWTRLSTERNKAKKAAKQSAAGAATPLKKRAHPVHPPQPPAPVPPPPAASAQPHPGAATQPRKSGVRFAPQESSYPASHSLPHNPATISIPTQVMASPIPTPRPSSTPYAPSVAMSTAVPSPSPRSVAPSPMAIDAIRPERGRRQQTARRGGAVSASDTRIDSQGNLLFRGDPGF
ncbi:hypothetical protein R3P38DRAFT_3191592 [Favolaschia claudopus]|uniref:Uncharacterized protein n=1 Tax=Favolaschia claudopus TaxID=2862362 RepID=A0AAW0BLG5_9AGAR